MAAAVVVVFESGNTIFFLKEKDPSESEVTHCVNHLPLKPEDEAHESLGTKKEKLQSLN